MEGPSAMATAGAPLRSKQKNCNGCVVAKRRCDRRTPTCSRCVEKMIPCTWGKLRRQAGPPAGSPSAAEGGDTVEREPAEEQMADTHMTNVHDEDAVPPRLPSPADNILIGTPSVCPLTSQMPFHRSPASGPPDNFPLFESINAGPLGISRSGPWPQANVMEPFLDPILGSGHRMDDWAIQLVPDPVVEIDRPGTPLDEDQTETYKRMGGFCKRLEPWHIYDPKQRVHYIVNSLKGFITDIATRGFSPFLHRHLYKDYTPPCIVACFSTCVLYHNRTADNTGMVVRAILTDVMNLIESDTDALGRAILMPLDKLARVQALLLYQIIRLLDGDVMLRAQGERDMARLEGWVRDLCKVRDNLGNLDTEDSGRVRIRPPEEWERWIFAESVRRTIIITQSFLKLYELMQGTDTRDDPNGFWAHAHRWTLSRWLWEADSSYDFTRMWRDKPQFVITNYKFEQFLEHGKGEDVDDFARILLTSFTGVDEAKEFFSEKS